MGTFLEKVSGTLVSVTIPAPDGEIERIVYSAKNFAMRALDGTLLMANVPSEEERNLLATRRTLLCAAMDHDRQKIALLIAQMLNCYTNPIKENETAEQVVALYVRELGLEPKVPTWAISQAVGRIRLGQAEGIGLVHRPSTIAVRRVADSFAWKAKAEIINITDVLKGRRAAPKLSPAERAKLSKRFQEFAADMVRRNAARAELDHREDAARLAAMIGQDAFAKLPDAPKRRGSLLGKHAAKIAAGGRR